MLNEQSTIKDIINFNHFSIVDIQRIEKRDPIYASIDSLNLSDTTKKIFSQRYPHGLYLHQSQSILDFQRGNNVCISTSTASGKSLIFYMNAIESLVKNPHKKILAIYPLKALGYEQEQRWQEILSELGNHNFIVGRIDGNVTQSSRMDILKQSSVLVMTPDIIHAWLFRNIGNPTVIEFLNNLEIIIVDEIHNYSGVFGSNSAFLFRRLNHFLTLLDVKFQYITSSATIHEPDKHLMNLFGLPFSVIGKEYDTSPKHQVDMYLIDPPDEDLLTRISKLLQHISQSTKHKFITFVDSRKQTENIASILYRQQKQQIDKELTSLKLVEEIDSLDNIEILPYRAGYEDEDRWKIQQRLMSGALSGVISTSALELGIDVPHLSIAVLVGVPNSATSFYQRIGRIGRNQEGIVLIINDNSITSQSIFRRPQNLMKLPLNESALYLENEFIQYIHAMCLCKSDGEHHKIKQYLNIPEDEPFQSKIHWSMGFSKLCEKEESGSIPENLQQWKSLSGDSPNTTFPLRDIGQQYRIRLNNLGDYEYKGELTFSQVMREAYPCGIYYYATKPYRVVKVNTKEHIVEVRPESQYFTKPIKIPTQIYPNLDNSRIKTSLRWGDLVIIECDLQIREIIKGYTEIRGAKKIKYDYPINGVNSLFFKQDSFTRLFFTTGIVIFSNLFRNPNFQFTLFSEILYESFLLTIPYDRNDLSCGYGTLKREKECLEKNSPFICLFDQTYGSLRLSSRLLDEKIFYMVIKKMIELSTGIFGDVVNYNTQEIIYNIYNSLSSEREENIFQEQDEIVLNYELIKIIAIGSKGLNRQSNNREFIVEKFFHHPRYGYIYQGSYTSWDQGNKGVISIEMDDLIEIPGVTKWATFNPDTMEINEL